MSANIGLQLSASSPFYVPHEASCMPCRRLTLPVPLKVSTLSAELLGLCWVLLHAEYEGSTRIELECQAIKAQNKERAAHIGTPLTQAVSVVSNTLLKDIQKDILDIKQQIPPAGAVRTAAPPFTAGLGRHKNCIIIPWTSGQVRKQSLWISQEESVLQLRFTLNEQLGFSCVAAYDESRCSQVQATRFVHQFVYLANQLEPPITITKVGEIDWLGPLDGSILADWNSRPPKPIVECCHVSFARHAQTSPTRPALSAWDGELTYGELDALSSQVAGLLLASEWTPGAIVPLLFEKSLWMVVSMLGVLKAGGVCVCICASHPDKSIEVLLQQIEFAVILTSESQHARLQHMQHTSLIVAREIADMPVTPKAAVNTRPEDLAFIIFTSGSTGTPKGIMLDHRAIATSAHYAGISTNVQPASRVLQFSSYAFDMSIIETWEALAQGGCLCIPSEEQRLNALPNFVQEHNVSWTFFTPSMLRSFQPTDFPSLDSLVLGGESVPRDLVLAWKDTVRLFNLWGPAETGGSGACEINAASWIPGTFGTATGCLLWIARPDDSNRLAALGTIGEVIIEGALVAQGYLGDPVRTQSAFIQPPRWRSQFDVPIQGRFFRTSDLVRYNPDGSVQYIGRKDTVVKINGQRVDIEAVESLTRKLDPGNHVTVNAITLQGPQQDTILVGFAEHPAGVAINWQSSTGSAADPIQYHKQCAEHSRRLQFMLSRNLPRFMVPSFIIPVQQFPRTATDKIDKKRMRDFVEQFSRAQIMQWLLGGGSKYNFNVAPPSAAATANETILVDAIARVFDTGLEAVDLDASFLQLGGDSLRAVHVVRILAEHNRSLRTESLLESSSCLHQVAAILDEKQEPSRMEVHLPEPFSMLQNKEALLLAASQQCEMAKSMIEDVYPSTALQEGLLSLTTSGAPEAYVDRFLFTLPATTNIDRAMQAWETVIEATSILRTRFIRLTNGKTFQVVARHHTTLWRRYKTVADFVEADSQLALGFGMPLLRLAVISATKSAPAMLALTMHHALYDGWTLALFIRLAEKAYQGAKLRTHPFAGFIKSYLAQQHLEESHQFWREQMADLSAVSFPVLPSSSYYPRTTYTVKFESPRLCRAPNSTSAVSPTSKLRLAWALLLSMYTDSTDVVFGTVVDGRNARLPDIESLAGPTIATLPIRIQIDKSCTVGTALLNIQDQMARMVPFQHVELQHIAQLDPQASMGSRFHSLLIVQPEDRYSPSSIFGPVDVRVGGFNDMPGYGLILICMPMAISCRFEILIDEQVVPRIQAEHMIQQFSYLLHQLDQSNHHTPLAQLDLLCPLDTAQLTKWHSRAPERIETCIHDLISLRCARHPRKIAICAWDGDFTYAELEHNSSQLAAHLRASLGSISTPIVPILIERSKWVAMAMLAIMKAGMAFVLLDVSQAYERNVKICRAIQAQIVLTSDHALPYASKLVNRTVVCEASIIASAKDASNDQGYLSSPRDLLYVVFTSGSTGEPKGVLIEHNSYASAIAAQCERLEIEPHSRVLQLSSYAFDSFAVEFLTVLCSGGCVCIPSAAEVSNDIADAIRRFQANWLCITPSTLRLFTPGEVPSLRTVVAVGESMLSGQTAMWAERVQLICGYGPSECCTGASVQPIFSMSADRRNIGAGMGALLWVVDQDDHNKLMPIGAVGELVIQGPIVGRGYLNDEAKTAAAFLEKTTWSSCFPVASRDRFYKTGDLAHYNWDGTCSFLGRKDQHTKLRGQRLDLAEVEHHLRQAFQPGSNVVATVIKPAGHESQPLLTALVQLPEEATVNLSIPVDAPLLKQQSQLFKQQVMQAQEAMSRCLPTIMVPAVYLQVSRMLLLPSGKVNRRALFEETSRLTTGELLSLGKLPADNGASELADEEELAWTLSRWLGDILGHKTGDVELAQAVVGRDVRLSVIGLDSIDMMAFSHLISREYCIQLPITTLFQSQLRVRTVVDLICQGTDTRHMTSKPMTWWKAYQKLQAEVDDLPVSPIQPSIEAHRKHTGCIFLTGGTGFLGTQILRQLVQDPQVRSVTVLVRSERTDRAMARLIHSARVAQWWRDEYRRVIRAWPGDLSKPQLGLSDRQWMLLCGRGDFETFDAIIHNGATVHWGYDYETLEATNVRSTMYLLGALARSDPTVAFTYISALLPQSDGLLDKSRAQALTDGYSQTKCASELLIAAFAQRHRNPIAIIRPGLLIGPVDNGVANVDDFLWRAVAAAIALGAYNSHEANSWLYVMAVDWVAIMIINETLYRVPSSIDDQNVSITTIADGLSMANFWQAIMLGIGYDLVAISAAEWMSLIQEQTRRVGPSHPMWPVVDFMSTVGGFLGQPMPSGSQPPSLTNMIRLAIARNVQYLSSLGSWTPPGTGFEAGCVIDEAVFRRNHQ